MELFIKFLLFLHHKLELLPITIVRYVRKTMIGIYDTDLRVTLDRRVTAGGYSLNRFDIENEFFILSPYKAILEVKSNKSVPIWLHSILLKYGISWVRFSKYGSAVIHAEILNKTTIPYEEAAEAVVPVSRAVGEVS